MHPFLTQGGWNMAAVVAVVAGVLPNVPGFLAVLHVLSHVHPVWQALYDCAWFVGVAVSSLVYLACMTWGKGQQIVPRYGST